ncbi:MAG: hypothetical protein J7M19_08275 [Planctomycetes bacterium]|nr:hypothetical protein [Planctomycetota bacterium]
MARDEAILNQAAGAEVTLRFYRWRPWAFSIGYFQKYGDFERFERDGIPVVRRLSGGGAIYHADEIAYGLVAPYGAGPFGRRAGEVFERVHSSIAVGLGLLGVEACLSDGPSGASPLICFSRPQRYDVVVGERKILGSAQRRKGGFFLQHGSLPLSPNRFAPEALSLGELVDALPDDGRLVEVFAEAFEEAFGLRFERACLAAGEEAEAAKLAAGKYAAGTRWNRRR